MTKKKSFCLLINDSPFKSQKSKNAIQFAKAIISIGDKLNSVFFYQNGVQHSNKYIKGNIHEINIIKQWKKIHKKYNTSLFICSESAYNNGLYNKKFHINKCFILSNLSTLIFAINKNDYFFKF